MNNVYCENWDRVIDRFTAWWNHEPIGYPLLRVIAAGKPVRGDVASPARGGDVRPPVPDAASSASSGFSDWEGKYTNAAAIVGNYRAYCDTHWFLEDAYPTASLNLGPGSLALYVGSEPKFAENTIWFTECIGDWDTYGGIKYDPENKWFLRHTDMLRTAVELARGDFPVGIPDIVENLDIVSALRGPQNLCYDLIDMPHAVHDAVKKIDDLYFKYYDAMYDIVKFMDGCSAFAAFNVLGKGRTAKIQCDFCALMSPDSFREYVQPSLRKQCERLDNTLYHLDGPDAIKHVPALMEIEELNALQWTCGAGQPDGGCERWYPIYDQVREAGKSLWVSFDDGSPRDWADGAIRLIKRYGPDCFYFIFPEFENRRQAEEAVQAIKDASRAR